MVILIHISLKIACLVYLGKYLVERIRDVTVWRMGEEQGKRVCGSCVCSEAGDEKILWKEQMCTFGFFGSGDGIL